MRDEEFLIGFRWPGGFAAREQLPAAALLSKPAGLAIPARPQLFLAEPHLLSIWDEHADLTGLDLELLREILRGDLDPAAANHAVRLLSGVAGGDALLRELGRRTSCRLVGMARPSLILPSRPPVPWSLPRPAAAPPSTIDLRSPSTEDEPQRHGADWTHGPVNTAVDAVHPFEFSSAERSTVAALVAPHRHTPPIAAWPSHQSAPTVAKRRKLIVGALAAAMATGLVLPSQWDRPATRAPIAANQPAPRLQHAAAQSAILAPQAAKPAMLIEAVASPRKPPGEPLASAAEPRARVPESVTVAAVAPAAKVVLPAPIPIQAALVKPQAAQTTIVAREAVPPSRRAVRKKTSNVAAAAPRKRPVVVTLVLPDVLKPQ